MGDRSGISWCHATWNVLLGCSPVSPGCLNCYAARDLSRGRIEAHRGLTKRVGGRAVFNGTVRVERDRWSIPLRWKRPRRIFVNALSDLFHEAVPGDVIEQTLGTCGAAPQHDYLVLTKREDRMREEMWSRAERMGWTDAPPIVYGDIGFPPANLWLGVSAETQDEWDRRVAVLQATPAAIRWVSVEPLLSRIAPRRRQFQGIDWIVIGGESGQGKHARPCDVRWIRSFVLEARSAGVRVWVKQLGDHSIGWTSREAGVAANARLDALMPDGWRRRFRKKGEDMTEWPIDLQVRELPDRRRVAA